MQTSTIQTPIILKWSCKKFRAVDNLKALHLKLIYLDSRGQLTAERGAKAIRQTRAYMAVLNYYKKRYRKCISNAN